MIIIVIFLILLATGVILARRRAENFRHIQRTTPPLFGNIFSNMEEKSWTYRYTKKISFMTRSERRCFNALMAAVGERLHVFPQVYLPTILDQKNVRQNWRAALAHINRKSVDFVLCDKENMMPIIAIEFDDPSHERVDRHERDREVERILKDATMPLLRLTDQQLGTPAELAQKIATLLK